MQHEPDHDARCHPSRVRSRRLPEWLKRPIPAAGGMSFTRSLVSRAGARDRLRKCQVSQSLGMLDPAHRHVHDPGRRLHPPLRLLCGRSRASRGRSPLDEPERLAEACHRLGLRHVVITSVTRDDLPDGGAEHFRQCVLAVRRRTGATIEVLTPDFDGRTEAIDVVLQARPEVFNHNMETVARLQQHVRRKSQYAVSLAVLEHAKRAGAARASEPRAA